MKPKFVLCIAVLVLIFSAILFLWHPKQRGITLELLLKTNLPLQNIQVVVATKTTNVAKTSVVLGTNQQPVSGREKTNAISQYMESQNKAIEFYGQMIDQDGNPISGVKIKAKVRHWDVIVPAAWGANAKEILVERQTDSAGDFEINGATGDGFDIESVYKDGFEAEPGLRTYGVVGGSIENPVIFKMWSANIHEHLITGEKKFQIMPDGRPYYINLTKGTISESGTGDIKVWVKYPPEVIYGQLYDWSCEINVINGGLFEEPLGSAMYMAPADGYKPSFQLQQQIKGGQYGEIGERDFYTMLRNGQEYGQIAINLYAPYTDQIPGMIRIQYAINPSGSRILR